MSSKIKMGKKCLTAVNAEVNFFRKIIKKIHLGKIAINATPTTF
jgi:hypothetical protein